jgi:hypothetical protein
MSKEKTRWMYNDDKTAVVIVDERLVVLTVSSPSQSEEFTFEMIHKTLGDFVTNKFHMAGERVWRISYDNASKANGAIDMLTSAGQCLWASCKLILARRLSDVGTRALRPRLAVVRSTIVTTASTSGRTPTVTST